MLTSLFGDLGAAKAARRDGNGSPDAGFAATAILASAATEVNARGQIVDRHAHDLVVTGSPAQAIREHFASTRSDLDTAASLITLLDPAGVWASAVIKALSDAGGRPVERLHLREHGTLRTLATIERATLVRRGDDTLKICHADVRAAGRLNAEVPVALMERSQMTTVIIGPLQPPAIDALLQALHAAAMLPTWRCPNLLFMLPPNAVWIAKKVAAIDWPGRLHVHVLSESMTGASSVWNAMLGMWNAVRSQTGWGPPEESLNEADSFPMRLSEFDASLPLADRAPRLPAPALDLTRAPQALAGMLAVDGLLGCALVDAGSGLVLARAARHEMQTQRRGNLPADIDMDPVAAACAQVLRAHRQAARATGLPDRLDEVLTIAGPRRQLIRVPASHPELFFAVLLDLQRSNLALARFQLMEVERRLF